MWELDCEEGWALKNWCFWIVVLEKILESPLDCKEIQPVHSKGDQPWDFFGRNDAKAETPVLWPPHAKSWLIGKDCDAGRDWGQEEKGTTEDEMAGWHLQLDGHEFEQTPGAGDDREAWRAVIHGVAESRTRLSDWTELNWTELNKMKQCLHCREHCVIQNTLTCVILLWDPRVSLAAALFITFGEPKSMIRPFKDYLLKHMSFYK